MKFSTERTARHNRQWSRTRKLGCPGFTLVFGVLLWGGLMIVAQYIFRFHISHDPPLSVVGFLFMNIPIWLTAGAAWGVTIWHITEKDYQKYLALHPETDAEPPPEK